MSVPLLVTPSPSPTKGIASGGEGAAGAAATKGGDEEDTPESVPAGVEGEGPTRRGASSHVLESSMGEDKVTSLLLTICLLAVSASSVRSGLLDPNSRPLLGFSDSLPEVLAYQSHVTL